MHGRAGAEAGQQDVWEASLVKGTRRDDFVSVPTLYLSLGTPGPSVSGARDDMGPVFRQDTNIIDNIRYDPHIDRVPCT